MEKFRVDIVGLHHHDVRSRDREYAAKAVGRQLVLQPQPENVKDPYAVRAREGRLQVGYVAVPDLDVVYQALAGSRLQRLRGVVVESNADPPVLTVEVEVERIDWTYEPFDDSVYAGWHYDGLPLMPRKMEELADLTADLTDALESLPSPNNAVGCDDNAGGCADNAKGCADNARGCDDNAGGCADNARGYAGSALRCMTESLLGEHLYDPSREMTRARYRLERLLAARSEPYLREAARDLRQQKGMLMRHVNRDHVARYLFIDLPTYLRQQGLEESHYTYGNRLDELEQQLRAFPWQMYDKFLADPVDFLREVYYKHVPRRHLFPLLSGIVLMILKGRVSIGRWGREGDTEPIELIQRLTPPLSPSERESAMKAALRELLAMRNALGDPVITQKNQWAGIISILRFDYGVPADDLRAFCRMMDDWGFGRESGYACHCDYESVSKCSTYANTAFGKWPVSGTARQRQYRAATELRAILRQKIGWR